MVYGDNYVCLVWKSYKRDFNTYRNKWVCAIFGLIPCWNMFISKPKSTWTSSTYRWFRHVLLHSLCPFCPFRYGFSNRIYVLLTRFGWLLPFFIVFFCFLPFCFVYAHCLMPTIWTLCTPKIHLALSYLLFVTFIWALTKTQKSSQLESRNEKQWAQTYTQA